MSKYTLSGIDLGDKVRVKGETEYGVVFELLSATGEVAARYSNGDEFDIDVNTLDSVVKAAQSPAGSALAPTTSKPSEQPSSTGFSTPVAATVPATRPFWDGTGMPPVGAIVVTGNHQGRPLKVVRHMRKYWRCVDERGQNYRVSLGLMRPTTLPFNETATDDRIKRGRLVTIATGDRHGMASGRLWVVLGPTKNNPGSWNCVPLDPPESFTYDYVSISGTRLTVRKFQNLTIPV
jgi:hypothetical protein